MRRPTTLFFATLALAALVSFGADIRASAATSPACPAGTQQQLAIRFPSTIAATRIAPISISDPRGEAIDGAELDLTQSGRATPFYRHTFGPGELTRLRSGSGRSFHLQVMPEDDQTTLTLTYELRSTPAGVFCTIDRSSIIKPSGQYAKATYLGGDGEFDFRAPGGCIATKVAPAALVVGSADTGRITAVTKDPCSGRWTIHDSIPGLDISQSRNEEGGTLLLTVPVTAPSFEQYTFGVGSNRQQGGGYIGALNQHTPAERVYQGTDAFVNYCINHDRPVYSYHLNLYCVRPASSSVFLDVSAKEP